MEKQQTDGWKPMQVIRKLCSLPHRGTTTENEKQAAGMLKEFLEEMGAKVEYQPFKTPVTYISITWWALGILILCLVLADWLSWWALGFSVAAAVSALLFFDWRVSPLIYLPPRKKSQNVIGRWPAQAATEAPAASGTGKKLILMAHYDTAPISILYHKVFYGNFHQSLIMSLVLLSLSPVLILLECLQWGGIVVLILRYVLVLYFLAQGVLATVDFLRHGYSRGAEDNASGVATALATARRLQANPIPGWELEVVCTGAEETALIGSLYYYKKYGKQAKAGNTYLINIDQTARGKLKIISRTGSISMVKYDNSVFKSANKIRLQDPSSQKVKIITGEWHTGDFDSIWFARAGIPALTVSTEKPESEDSRIHRPEDLPEYLEEDVLDASVDFIERIARDIMESAD